MPQARLEALFTGDRNALRERVLYMHWATARLLPRLLAGRTAGPVFLADPAAASG
ncbi:hypothetical protein [Nonomuraea basaltis]|uniref:hypothetical protein n=1 Tax=Nonomuraea basaltis TaxID=2495887 RepID=UPI0019819981|nr:hypothetical protein [Nonomuraea basaltis]